MITWPNLGLNGEFEECEDALAAINENFLILDALSQITVAGQVPALPPIGATGEMYIVNGTGEVFVFTDKWVNLGVKEGWTAYDTALDVELVYDGTAWVVSSVEQTEEPEPATTTVPGLAPGPVGSLVYNSGSGFVLANNQLIDQVGVAMIVAQEIGEYKIQTSGPVNIPGHGFNVGEYYFGADTGPGAVTNIKPIAGTIHKSAFHVSDNDNIELLLQNEPVVVSQSNFTFQDIDITLYRSSTGQAVPEATDTDLLFNEPIRTAAYLTSNANNSLFTIQEDGVYDIYHRLTYVNQAGLGVTSQMESKVVINASTTFSSLNTRSNTVSGSNQNGNQSTSTFGVLQLSVGDTIRFVARTVTSSDATRTLLASSVHNYIQINKRAKGVI